MTTPKRHLLGQGKGGRLYVRALVNGFIELRITGCKKANSVIYLHPFEVESLARWFEGEKLGSGDDKMQVDHQGGNHGFN
jgi:hypothetical protein